MPVSKPPSLPATREEHLRRLRALKAELLQEGDDPIEPVRDEAAVTSRPDEDAQPLAEMSQVIASSRNRARTATVQRVLAALARLEQDPESFGLCQECGEEIPAGRLKLMPYVELCVECQQAHDAPNAPSGRRHLRDFR
jgi:DnaK suppressor protein